MAEPDPVAPQLNSLFRVPVCGAWVGQPVRGPAFFGAGAGPGRSRGGAERRKAAWRRGHLSWSSAPKQAQKGRGLGFVDVLRVSEGGVSLEWFPHTWLRQKTEERRRPAEGVGGSLDFLLFFESVSCNPGRP